MVRLAQTIHLSCTDTNTVFKWIEMRFHMTHVTKVSFGCVQNDFRAHGTFSANRAPMLHRYKHYLQMVWNEITWPTSPKCSTGVSKMIFEPMVCSTQTVHLFCIKLALSPNRPKRTSTWASSPTSTIRCVQNDFWSNGTFCETMHLSCAKISSISKQT
jgi:hypothetical protein